MKGRGDLALEEVSDFGNEPLLLFVSTLAKSEDVLNALDLRMRGSACVSSEAEGDPLALRFIPRRSNILALCGGVANGIREGIDMADIGLVDPEAE